MNRRKFFGLAGRAAASCIAGGCVYGVIEAKTLQASPVSIRLPELPAAFHGMKIALLADIHHSAFVPLDFIGQAVAMANAFAPDLVILGGDYITAGKFYILPGIGPSYIAPCFDMLKNLKARHGVFAVTGNHDQRAGVEKVNAAISGAGIKNITNQGVWLTDHGQRLRICGVGDLNTQHQDLPSALGDAREKDAAILVSHNPDYAEMCGDRRVRLILSGHTHGGQVVLPLTGAPLIPSKYGQKFRHGLVQMQDRQVFITSGVGTLPLAVRIHCPPEVTLITLTS